VFSLCVIAIATVIAFDHKVVTKIFEPLDYLTNNISGASLKCTMSSLGIFA